MGAEQDDIPTVDVVSPAKDHVEALPPTLGRYSLLQKIGQGGMGVVYRAYDPELDREVALKRLRRVGDLDAERRLFREAQMMAQLSHPNVVPVYDVGADGEDVFIAMEYVRGRTLLRFLAGDPGWPEVVRHFIAAGHGVVAAHERGLVHRDFKPANVLIGEDGRARVTDFGLARSQGSITSEHTQPPTGRVALASSSASELSGPLTEAGVLVGTPAYMAPEQHHGEPADARSDQFSFCVALFEGLFHRRPFAGTTAEEYLDNKERGAIVEVEVGPVPRRLVAAVHRGLHRDPDRRWASLHALLVELTRASRPAGRRSALVLGVAGASLLVGGLTLRAGSEPCLGAEESLAETWNDGRRVAIAEAFSATGLRYADSAWTQAERALDASVDAYLAEHHAACVATRELGDEAAQRRLDERMACLADWRARVDATLLLWERADAPTVEHAAGTAASLPDPARCADPRYLDAAQPPPGDPELARRVAAVRAELRLADAQFGTGHPDVALEHAEPALEEAEATDYRPVVAEALYTVAHALELTSQYDRAFTMLERAYLAANAIGYDELAAKAAVEEASLAGFRRADYETAESWLAHARAAAVRYGDPEQALLVQECEGSLALHKGDYEAAIEILREAVEDREAYPGVSELARAEPLETLGSAYRHAGKHAEALAAFERVAEIRSAATPDHPQTATAMNNVANALTKLGRYDEAAEMFAEVLQVYRRAYGEEHADISMVLSNMGAVEIQRGNMKEAVELLKPAIEMRKRTLGPKHPEVGVSLLNLGAAYSAQGDFANGEPVTLEAIEILREAHGPDHPQVATALANVASLQAAVGKHEEALANYDAAERGLVARVGKMHENVATIVALRGELRMDMDDIPGARAEFRRSIAIYEATLGAGHPEIGYSLVKLGDCDVTEGKLDDAEEHYRRTIQIMSDANARTPVLADAEFKLARLLGHADPEAIALATEARDYFATQSATRADDIDAWLKG